MHRTALCAFVLAASMPAFGAGFHALSVPGSQLAVLSADGQSAAGGVVGGDSGGFRWREGESATALSGAMSVRAMSASGSYVAGSSLDADQREVATWWSVDGTAHPLGGLPGADAQAGVLSVASGVTDRPSVVGTAVNAQRARVAFAWTSGDGMRLLASPGAASGASGISGDGSRIYGWIERSDLVRHGVVWNQGRLCCALDTGTAANEIVGANRDATLLLGLAQDDGGADAPFRWRPDRASSQEPLVSAPTVAPLRFTGGSDDGRLLVGTSKSGAQRYAMVWTAENGALRLDAFAVQRGVAIPPGWTLIAATAVNADGTRVGGFGLVEGRFDSFVIDLPPATHGADAHSFPAPERRHSQPEKLP